MNVDHQEKTPPVANREFQDETTTYRPPPMRNDGFLAGHNRFSKIDFPQFDGKKPRSWVRKCDKYFSLFGIQEHQKVELAAMYMQERADTWVQGYLMQRRGVCWKEMSEALCTRFGEKQGVDVVVEFNKLSQKEDLEDYNERFEELRAGMLSYNPHLPESYFVTSYICGLKAEIEPLVKLGRPKDLAEALELARLHQDVVQALVRINKPPWRPSVPSVRISKL